MAKRTLNQIALLLIDRVDKSRTDATLVSYCESMVAITLQEILAQVTYAEWLGDEQSVVTAASTQYSATPATLDVDNIVSVRNETNNIDLLRITPEDADRIDPKRTLQGLPYMWWHEIVGGVDRLYWMPQPDAIYTHKIICSDLVTDPTTGQTTVFPAKYESILMDGALVKIWERLDPDHDTSKIQARYEGGYNQAGEAFGVCRIIKDAKNKRGENSVMTSHRPTRSTPDFAPRFPSDFDITP